MARREQVKAGRIKGGLLSAGLLGLVALAGKGGVDINAARFTHKPVDVGAATAAAAQKFSNPEQAFYYGFVLGPHFDANMAARINGVAAKAGVHPANVVESLYAAGARDEASLNRAVERSNDVLRRLGAHPNARREARLNAVLSSAQNTGLGSYLHENPKLRRVNKRFYDVGTGFPSAWASARREPLARPQPLPQRKNGFAPGGNTVRLASRGDARRAQNRGRR